MNFTALPKLHKGSHLAEQDKGCVMEWSGVFWLTSNGWNFEEAWKRLTDKPVCTDPTITLIAQLVNDALPDKERQRLADFIPRLVRASTPLDVAAANRMSWEFVNLALAKVLTDEKVINHLQALVEKDPIKAGLPEIWDYRRVILGIDGDHTTSTATYDFETYRDWVCEAVSLASDSGTDTVAMLDELLDAWDKLKAEHGVMHEPPPVPPTLAELDESELELAEWASQ